LSKSFNSFAPGAYLLCANQDAQLGLLDLAHGHQENRHQIKRKAMMLFRPAIYAVLVFVFVGFLVCPAAYAQMDLPSKHEKDRAHKKKIRHQSDSVWKKDIEITDTAAALVLSRIENINTVLANINDVIDRGYDTSEAAESLPVFDRSIQIIKYNIANQSEERDLNRLYLEEARLTEMSEDLKDWQGSLLSYYTVLVGLTTQVRSMAVDSSTRDLPVDTTLRHLYLRQLKDLQSKWRSTDTVTKHILLRIDLLQSRVSGQYFDVVGLQKQVKGLIKSYSKKAFGNEYGYLWEPYAKAAGPAQKERSFSGSLSTSGRVLQYYFSNNLQRVGLQSLLFFVFILWTLVNLRRLRRNNPDATHRLKYIRHVAVLSSLVIMLAVAPFVDLQQRPPIQFIQLLQLLLTLALTLLVFGKWPRPLYISWLFIAGLFFLHLLMGFASISQFNVRMGMIFFDLLAAVAGLLFFREVKGSRQFFPRYFRGIIILYIGLSVVAILCNVMGRVTLARISESAAMSGLVLATGLIVFMDIFLDAIYLQLEADKKSRRFTAYLNYENVGSHILRILTVLTGLFWFVNLAQNLNVYDIVYDAVSGFLTEERNIGSANFTIGSILIFFFIIWLANVMQKYIGYFFGDSGDDLQPEKKSKLGTSILLVRLLVLTAGFLLGVTASGIPLDRVTIVIGALGVGIGLGLQNIVNNLVSGVILAIERPIQVGDLIDVGTSSGRVKEIGIRSTRMVTADGAEVVIPNGDMLSQKLVNWTLSNNHMRVEIDLKLADGANLSRVQEIILASLAENPEVMKTPEPRVLFRSISQSGADVQVLFWANDINNWVQVKSDCIRKIYEIFRKENLAVI
jgi:potassium-dependent mechanosensitive channel